MPTRFLSFVVAFLLVLPAFAQSAEPAGEDLLRALLTELRALRATLQRNSGLELRGQLLLERYRTQQQIVRELSREIEHRDVAIPTRMEHEPYAHMTEDLEHRIAATTDPGQRRQLEREREMMNRRREMEEHHREEMRLRFQRQEMRLLEERAKLEALERELAALEAEMAR
jgi:hypothetical protein